MFGSVKSSMSGESQHSKKNDSFNFEDFASKVSGEKRESLESQVNQGQAEKSKAEDINFSMFGSVKSASKEQVDLDDFASKVSGEEKRESIESQVVTVKAEKSKAEDINFSMFGSVKSGKSQKSQIA